MKKIFSGTNEVYIQKKFLSKKECNKYFKMIHDIGHRDYDLEWDKRMINITKDPITNKVTLFLNKIFNLNLIAKDVEIQNWHINSSSDLHNHKSVGRGDTNYNSLIYLNDDFEGGHFITKEGIRIKPEQGMLTFFNGQKLYHGVEKTFKKDRKTIIFWWR